MLDTYGGGGGAIKAEGICRLVLPGVRKCSHFEEGILRVWMGAGKGGGWDFGLGGSNPIAKTCREIAGKLRRLADLNPPPPYRRRH